MRETDAKPESIPSPPVYTFVPTKINSDDDGLTQIDNENGTIQLNAFQRCREPMYTEALLSIFRTRLEKL